MIFSDGSCFLSWEEPQKKLVHHIDELIRKDKIIRESLKKDDD